MTRPTAAAAALQIPSTPKPQALEPLYLAEFKSLLKAIHQGEAPTEGHLHYIGEWGPTSIYFTAAKGNVTLQGKVWVLDERWLEAAVIDEFGPAIIDVKPADGYDESQSVCIRVVWKGGGK